MAVSVVLEGKPGNETKCSSPNDDDDDDGDVEVWVYQ